MLDVAVYSDTSAEESVDGVEGFNFRAVSGGITAADRSRIREDLLHRIHPLWSHDHDELAHPPTCAHLTYGDRHYLARGHSTGLTLSGRPGNLVTQVLVTDDPAAFGGYHPAQLYAATGWTLADSPSGDLEPWPAPTAVRPDFEAPALAAMLRDDPWAARILPGFLAMLEAACADAPSRLVLVHRDLDVVMRWIAAGSLLLDDAGAARLTFRALVDDPWRSDAAVIGVSPEFDADPVVGCNIVDLERRTTTDVQPTAEQVARVQAFLGAPGATPAHALAAAWEPHVGADLATRAASALRGAIPTAGAWRLAVEVVDTLVAAGEGPALVAAEPDLVAGLRDWRPATPDEVGLARATRQRVEPYAASLAATLHDAAATGLDDVVTSLVGALETGDRGAELAVVDGTWDWLADEPDAAAAHPWLEAAVVGRLPREQRPEAIAHEKLKIRTWPIALGRPTLPRDTAVVTAWLRHQGIDDRLAKVVRDGITALRAAEPSADPVLDDLLAAVLHAPYYGSDFPDDELADLTLDYAPVHERIEAARDRVGERANRTLRPLLDDLESWGPAVAPHLGACLLDAVDARAVAYVAAEAADWAAAGVRSALRSRYKRRARTETVRRAIAVASGPHEAMARGAREFLVDDLKAAAVAKVRADLDRPDRDRLDALLRSAGSSKRRIGGRSSKVKGT